VLRAEDTVIRNSNDEANALKNSLTTLLRGSEVIPGKSESLRLPSDLLHTESHLGSLKYK
jgi:hypothetical protein